MLRALRVTIVTTSLLGTWTWATVVRVEHSDRALIRLIISPTVDDSVWSGWVGLPPHARIVSAAAVARGSIRPVPWDPGLSWRGMPSVRLGPVGRIRFHRVVPLRVALASRSATGGAGLPEEVVVTLTLRGARPPSPVTRAGFETLLPQVLVNWDSARNWTEMSEVADPPPAVPAPSVRVLIADEGLYRLTYEDLDPVIPGTGAIDSRGLALWNRGSLIPIRVASSTNTWQPGDWIEFYAHGNWREDPQGRWSPVEGKYTRHNAYYFIWDALDPPRILDIDATPQGGNPAAYHWWPCHNESNTFPSISGHRGSLDDEWYWGGPFYPGELTKPFVISDLSLEGPRAQIRARFLAITDVDTVQVDHTVNLLVNGQPVGNASWGGYGAQVVDGTEVGLNAGQNQLTIQSTGTSLSGLLLDYFAVRYPRRYLVSGGQTIFGPSTTNNEYLVSGLNPGTTVEVFEVPAGVRLTGFPNVADHEGTVRFHHTFADTSRIVITSSDAWMGVSDLAEPLASVLPRTPLADQSRRGQFLVVYGSDDELEAADGFRDFHLGRGDVASAEIVAVDEIWDEFSYGMLDPRGLRWFLQWALANWADPPEFVLLLGDGTWDYNGYLGPGRSANLVPSYGNPASDNFYASLNDTSFYPDVYLGRIPALNGSQAVTALAKVQAYLAAPPPDNWRKRTLFVTGGATTSDFGLFGMWVNALHHGLIEPPPTLGTVSWIAKDVENYWPGFYNSTIRAAIDSGCVLVNFFGHGATATWDYMLESEDAALLNNGTRMPFMLSPTCFTGDFADPRDTVFAEHFLRLDDTEHGAIGFFGSSGTSYLTEGFEYAWALFSALFRQQDRRMGPAVSAAKLSSYPWPTYVDSIMASVYNLMGDPLLPLAFPDSPDLHVDASSVTFNPPDPAAADSVAMLVVVTNEGITWSSPVTAMVERGGVVLDSASFTPDSLENRVVLRWQAGGTPGNETLRVTVDPEGSVPDPDESDNSVYIQLTLLKPRPDPLMPIADAMLAETRVRLIAAPAGVEPHYFQIATSVSFGDAVVDSSAAVLPQGAIVSWTWQAPVAGPFCWRARVDGGAWSAVRWFTIAPPDSGWAQSESSQFATLDLSRCEASDQGLGLTETVSARDFALLAEGATVQAVSSYNSAACGTENLIGGTTINTDWGGAFYFLRQDLDQWAVIDLGQERMITRIASAHEGQALTKRSVWSYFGIETWVDGQSLVDWGHTPDYADSGYGPWISSYIAYEKPDPIPVRYIRFRYGQCYPEGPVYEGSRVYEVYAFPASYPDSGWATTAPIGPAASWTTVSSSGLMPQGTDAVVQILLPDSNNSWEVGGEANLGEPLPLDWLNAAEYPRIRLRALLSSAPRDVTPRLTSWRVSYATIPDLTIEPDTVLVSPAVPTPGSGADVLARIVNAGSSPLSSAPYQLTVSENGADPRLLDESFTGWLAPGASESVVVAWQVVPGIAVFSLTVDPLNSIEESDEGNNGAVGEARVVGNLEWGDSITVDPQHPAPGETLSVYASAVNTGVTATGQTRASCVWAATTDTTWAILPSLDVGQSVPLTWSVAVPDTPGDATLMLELDPDTLVTEVTRSDNGRVVGVEITQLADPAIADVSSDCVTPPIGDPFEMRVSVANQGGRPTGDLVLSCTQLGAWTEDIAVGSLAPEESSVVSVLWPTGDQPATLSFLLVIDPDSLVADGNRANNAATFEVTSQRGPDIVCHQATTEPRDPVAGASMILTTSIRNRSIDSAPGFRVSLRDPVAVIGEQMVEGLGGQRTVDLRWDLLPQAAGPMTLLIDVDTMSEVDETCEGNNSLPMVIPVAAPWDLAVSDEDLRRLDPAKPFVSWDSLALVLTIHNAGEQPSPPVVVELFDGLPEASGVAVDSARTDSLPPAQSDTLSLWWPSGTSPGLHIMTAVIDPRGELQEWNTGNNRALRTIEVVADTVPPGVEVRPPWVGFQDNGYLTPDDTLSVLAWDAASGVKTVALMLDGVTMDLPPVVPDSSTGSPGVLVRTLVPGSPGPHAMVARSEDRAGLASEARLMYTIPGGVAVSGVAAFPSPASGPTWITAKVSMPGDLTVTIYTPSGRLVRLLEMNAPYPGRAGAEWDLCDEDGDRVANGVYLVHMTLRCAGGSAGARGSLVVRR